MSELTKEQILLTDEEIQIERYKVENDLYKHTDYDITEWDLLIANAQLKKALIGVGRESKRMDGTTYLVPDYHKYREALKEVAPQSK